MIAGTRREVWVPRPADVPPTPPPASGPGGRRSRAWTLTAAALIGLLLTATVVGFLGERWWLFEVLSNPRPQYALLLAALAVGCVRTGRRLLALLALAGMAANVAPVVPLYRAPAPVAAPAGGDVLRLMVLNVKLDQADPEALASHLRTARHDLVFLVAATDAWSDALRDADIPYSVLVSRPRGVDLELVVLGRRPDLPSRIHRWGDASRSAAVEVVPRLGDAPVRVLATHPVSPMSAARAEQRDRQLERVARWARDADTPFVVVGDLNATPWSPAFRRLLRDGGMRNSQQGHGMSATWPAAAGAFGIPIDHVLHAPELVTVERRLGPGFGSAHRSVQVTLARR